MPQRELKPNIEEIHRAFKVADNSMSGTAFMRLALRNPAKWKKQRDEAIANLKRNLERLGFPTDKIDWEVKD